MGKKYESRVARRIDDYKLINMVTKSEYKDEINCVISAIVHDEFLTPVFESKKLVLLAAIKECETGIKFGTATQEQLDQLKIKLADLIDGNTNPAHFYADKASAVEHGRAIMDTVSDEIKRECKLIAADATGLVGIVWNIGTITEIRKACDDYRINKLTEDSKISTDALTALIRTAFKAYDRKEKGMMKTFESAIRKREQLVIADYLTSTKLDMKRLDWKDISDKTIASRLVELIVFKHTGGRLTMDEIKNRAPK